MKTYLNFGGFYQSYHGEAIESWVEPDWDDYQDYQDYQAVYDWPKARQLYALLYVDWFNMLFDVDLKLIRVWSPKEYNFQTDALEVELSEAALGRLKTLVQDNYAKEFEYHLKTIASARAGYIPLFTEKSIQKEPDRLAEVYLDVLIQQAEANWREHFEDVHLDMCQPEEFLLNP